MDPTGRRRLTVLRPDEGSKESGSKGGGSPSAATSSLRLQEAGLREVFSKEELGTSKAVFISSITDRDGKNRRSFADKDQLVLVPPDGDDKALRAWVEEKVGFVCKKGLKPESPNQDSFSVLVVENQFALYGVYDGHGPFGHDVSEMARQTLVKLFLAHPKRTTDTEAVLTEVFLETQKILAAAPKDRIQDVNTSGSTCTVAYHDMVRETLTIAHVGDSRSVIGKRKAKGLEYEDVLELTIDHKPNLEKERKRIEGAKPPGRVVFDGYYNHRVFAQNGMYPGLNMSRALGDVIAHQEAGLTAEPDVHTINLRDERAKNPDLTLLICTDGVWEFIESKMATDMVASFDQALPAVEKLAKESWDRWMADSDHEISDDITALLVNL